MNGFVQRIIIGAAFIFAVLYLPHIARASDSPVKRYTFSGTVDSASGTPLGLHASAGDIVTGTFGYDTSIPLSVEHGTYGASSSWGDSLQTDSALFSVTVNGVTVFGDASGFHFQLFDEYYGMWDEIKCYSQWESSDRVMNSVFFQVFYPHELFSSDISYPSTINFSGQENYGWVQSFGDFPGGQNEGQIRFTITSIASDTPAQPPVADAGSLQTVASGDVVHLDASNSVPKTGVTYQWAQLSGAPVTLSDPAIVNPTFTAPDVGQDGSSLVFQVTVTNASGQSSQDSCTVTVTHVNPPSGDQCAQCSPSLVSWWAAEDNANDIKGINMGTLSGGAMYAPGKVGQAFSLNGNTGSIVVVPDDASLNFDTHSPMTIELWAYRTGTNPNQHILGKRADCGVNINPDHNYQMGWFSYYGDWFGSYSGGAPQQGEADLPLNTWTHLSGTFDGTTFKFYVNGVLAGTGTGILGPIFATPFTMGTSGTCGSNYGQGFVGLLDEVSLYNSALSATEISAIYNAGSAGKCRGSNRPPVADAGADQSPRTGDQVVLDGARSSDPENKTLSYLWTQVSGPQVELSDATVAKPTFTAPNVPPDGASLNFKLTVTDPGGLSGEDTCIVNVVWLNRPPVADAGGNQTVNAGAQVALNGSHSTDPDDGIVAYRWEQLSGTPPVTLNNATDIQPTFIAPNVVPPYATLTFGLTVTDAGNLTSTAQSSVRVNWVNTPPTADAGVNVVIQSQYQNTTTLTGTAADADREPLNYRWLEGTDQIASGVVGADGSAPLNLGLLPRFSLADHTLILEITDGHDTTTDSMILTVGNSAPTAVPSGEGTYQVNDMVRLSGTVSDYDGDTLHYAWLDMDKNVQLTSGTIGTIIGGTPVSLPEFAISSLTVGVHLIGLRVNDGTNEPVTKPITVTIIDTTAPTLAPIADKTILWPPNKKMVGIIIRANASDNSGIPVQLSVAIACNESANGEVYWTTPVIDQTTGIISIQFMADRSGKGDGRQYTVTITATDDVGNKSTANVKIVVPHDQGKN